MGLIRRLLLNHLPFPFSAPFNLGDTDCNQTPGRYQVQVARDAIRSECVNDKFSIITVGKSMIIVDVCVMSFGFSKSHFCERFIVIFFNIDKFTSLSCSIWFKKTLWGVNSPALSWCDLWCVPHNWHKRSTNYRYTFQEQHPTLCGKPPCRSSRWLFIQWRCPHSGSQKLYNWKSAILLCCKQW